MNAGDQNRTSAMAAQKNQQMKPETQVDLEEMRRVGERWRDGAGSFATSGYPATKMLAHTRWRRRSVRPIFDCRETAMELCRLPSTVCERVKERWRDGVGSFATSGIRSLRCLHTVHNTHVGAGGRCGRFSTVEKRRWNFAGCQAQSASVWGSDGASAWAVLRPRVSGH